MIRFGCRALWPCCLAALSFVGAGCSTRENDGKKDAAAEKQSFVPNMNVDVEGAKKWALDNGETALRNAGELAKKTFDDSVELYRDDAKALLNQAGGGLESGLDYVTVAPGEKPKVEK